MYSKLKLLLIFSVLALIFCENATAGAGKNTNPIVRLLGKNNFFEYCENKDENPCSDSNNWKKAEKTQALPINTLLRIPKGAKIKIICSPSEKTSKTIRGKANANFSRCFGSGSSGDNSTVFPTHEHESASYLISPRSSLLRSDKPMIRWKAVPHVKEYALSLFKDKQLEEVNYVHQACEKDIFLEKNCLFEKIDYPRNWKPLERGHTYEIKIQYGGEELPKKISHEKSDIQNIYEFSQRGVDGLGFRLVSESTEKLLGKNLDTSDQDNDQLYQALVYNSFNLHSEASQILESLVEKNPQEPIESYRFLAEFYAYSGLKELARDTFKKALDNAKKAKDNEEINLVKESQRVFECEVSSKKELPKQEPPKEECEKDLN